MQREAKSKDSARERAIKRCKENRGVDCDTMEGLLEYLREDRPLTPEEQSAAAGAVASSTVAALQKLCIAGKLRP